MHDAQTKSPPHAGPTRHNSLLVTPQLSTHVAQDGARSTTADYQPPSWRTQYRPDSPHPHYARIAQPTLDHASADGQEGREGERPNADDVDTSSHDSSDCDEDGNPIPDLPEADALDRIEASTQRGQKTSSTLSDDDCLAKLGHPGRGSINSQASKQASPTDSVGNRDDPPSLNLSRQQSHASTGSQSTNLQTPAHPPVPLPDEPVSLAQQVWRNRKIRRRILTHMSLPDLATMCRVNRRMYTCAIAELVRTIYYSDLIQMLEGRIRTSYPVRLKAIIGSIKHLKILDSPDFFSWTDFQLVLRSLGSMVFFKTMTSGHVGLTFVHKVMHTSRYGRRTFVVSHSKARDILSVFDPPPGPVPVTLPPDCQIIHRYLLKPTIPKNRPDDTLVNSEVTDFSPLGDRIWSIECGPATTFATAYEQLQLCVQKHRCPREFWWTKVGLRLWRITIVELRMLLELLQAKHICIDYLKIELEFKDQGTMSTADFVMAGPSLWRLLGKFLDVTLDFRHESEPMALPGKGPKGLSAFTKSEQLHLRTFEAFAAIPPVGPIDRWKFSFEHIFGEFLSRIVADSCEIILSINDVSRESPVDVKRYRLYENVDLGPIKQIFNDTHKSTKWVSFMWEWEHGSLAPTKVPPPRWSKMKPRALGL